MDTKSFDHSEKKSRNHHSTPVKSKFILLSAFEIAKREIDSFTKTNSLALTSKLKSQEHLLQTPSKKNYLQKIKAKERNQEKKAFEQYKLQTSKSIYDDKLERKSKSVGKLEERLSNARLYKINLEKQEDQYSKQILASINKRLERSCKNYDRILKNKQKFNYFHKNRAQSVSKVYDDRENKEKDSIIKILNKRQESEIRKQKVIQELQNKLKQEHDKKEIKLAQAQEYQKKQEKIYHKKSLELENKAKKYENFIIQQQDFKEKKIKQKIENKKLKQIFALEKCEKNKKNE